MHRTVCMVSHYCVKINTVISAYMHEDKYAYIYMHTHVCVIHICIYTSVSYFYTISKIIFKILVKLVTSKEKYRCMWTKDGRSIFLIINFLYSLFYLPCLNANSKINININNFQKNEKIIQNCNSAGELSPHSVLQFV